MHRAYPSVRADARPERQASPLALAGRAARSRSAARAPSVGPAELPAHVPASVLQQLDGLSNATLQKARKGLGIWASNRRFLAAVAARNATPALYIEDDAELKPALASASTQRRMGMRAQRCRRCGPERCRGTPSSSATARSGTRPTTGAKLLSDRDEHKAPLWLSKGRAQCARTPTSRVRAARRVRFRSSQAGRATMQTPFCEPRAQAGRNPA